MQLELISFKLCPYAQRAAIVLHYKQIPATTTYIDLATPPSWFKQISPFGKVPVLRVDGESVLFESAVIAEFLDDISGGSLLPTEPLRRALTRSWSEFGAACIGDLISMLNAKDASSYDSAQAALQEKLRALEGVFGESDYFNGPQPGLLDFAYAPLFMRIELINAGDVLYPAQQCPRIAGWSTRLLALPAVQDSVVGDFDRLLREKIERTGPYLAQLLGY
ncbi:MAG: hypothetical protein AMJ69_01985 [Gammaproteobacteria bacterium SG8_47]|nr:MAG: hypothetical protein AMJ69_01985 [Gammaproteobacteria bacterium SG8_47]